MKFEKKDVFAQVEAQLAERLRAAEAAVAVAIESRNNDTKSSAGDKYETGREMMQREIDKGEALIGQIAQQQRELARMAGAGPCTQVQLGALVESTTGHYLIGIGLGRLELRGTTLYAISLASPLGQALRGHTAGDQVTFNGRPISILSIQ